MTLLKRAGVICLWTLLVFVTAVGTAAIKQRADAESFFPVVPVVR